MAELRLLRVKFALPRSIWLSVLTRRHPDCRVEVRDRMILKNRFMLTEARFYGGDTGRWAREVGQCADVSRVKVVARQDSNCLVWVTHRIASVTQLCRELEVIPQYPFWAANGHTTWEVLGRAVALRRFVDSLSHLVFSVRIEAVATANEEVPPSALTERQVQLFRLAMDEGYFEVPRRISLTELAGRASLSKSTLSRTLAVAEGKLLQNAERFGLLSNPRATARPPPRAPRPSFEGLREKDLVFPRLLAGPRAPETDPLDRF